MYKSGLILGIVFSFFLAAFKVSADDIQAAAELYQQRQYTTDGIKIVKQAADLYSKAAQSATGLEKQKLLIRQSDCIYFIAVAITDLNLSTEEAKSLHLQGLKLATEVSGEIMRSVLGPSYSPEWDTAAQNLSESEKQKLQTLDDANKDALAEAMYWRASNYGAWMQLQWDPLPRVEVEAAAKLMKILGRKAMI